MYSYTEKKSYGKQNQTTTQKQKVEHSTNQQVQTPQISNDHEKKKMRQEKPWLKETEMIKQSEAICKPPLHPRCKTIVKAVIN